jgi:hypothetical protein
MSRQSSPLPTLMSASVLALVLGLNSRPATAQVTVTTATPNNAPQGTNSLNVTVAGDGFERGAKATWFVSGTTNTGGVTVNSTTFVGSSQVVANITIAGNATLGGFDIAVTNANGRTGVGSDSFTVNPEAVTSFVGIGNNFTIQGDGSAVNSGASTYENTPETSSTTSNTSQSTCIIMSLLPNDWYLRLNSSSGRNIHLTFQALGSSPNESALDNPYPADVATRCFDKNNNWLSIPLTIPPATSYDRCSLRVNFSANGTNYLYVMGPIYAGTGWSTVHCTSGTATATCHSWTITPTPASALPLPNQSLANVANLYSVAKSGKLTLIGTYSMTFSFTLTQP